MTPATDAAREADTVAFVQSWLMNADYDPSQFDRDFAAAIDARVAAALTEAAGQPREGGGHTDDMAVDRFAAQMKAKLAAARTKGRGGWDDPEQCSPEELSAMRHEHVAKGDPIDVANFCMMLAHYGVAIVSAPGGKQAAGSDEPCSCILSDPDGEPVGGACPACIAALATKAKKADDDSGIILPLLSEEQLAEIQQIADCYSRAALTQRPPEQAGAVPAADLALTKAIRFTAYNRADPLAIRFEFADDTDRLEAADEIDVILSEAFAQARARMAAALAEARIGRDGPAKVRVKPAAPTPPDAGPGEIPAGMVQTGREGCVGSMDPKRASYFLERFKREEMLLGPHEQWALDYTIAVLAAPTPPDAGIGSDGAGERYRHVKRGTVYEVIGNGTFQCGPDPMRDDAPVVIYRGQDGKLWVRDFDEFHDGRFEPLATQPGDGGR